MGRIVAVFRPVCLACTLAACSAAEYGPSILNDPFPPAPFADEVEVRLWPASRLDTLGSEMVAVFEITNVCTAPVDLAWQPRGDSILHEVWIRHDVDGLRLSVDEQVARRHGIRAKIGPLFGGSRPILTLQQGETRQTGIRIDEYLGFSEPISEPVTVTWTLRLREGQTKTGTFTLRIASARDPLDDYLKHLQETQDRSEPRIDLEPPWEPSR